MERHCKDCDGTLHLGDNWSEARARKRTYVCTPCSHERNRKRPKGVNRSSWLMRNYGLTIEDYDMMYVEQEGSCAICGVHSSEIPMSLAVDHCHDTGAVRGLLCTSCNTTLGNMGDNPALLREAAKYLEERHG